MFDFHLHSSVSFDSDCSAFDIVKKAEKLGLREICFTDHYDYDYYPDKQHNLFSLSDYSAAYDLLDPKSLKILRGVEFGLTKWNKPEFENLLSRYNFDFVIGSVHFANGYDPYFKDYWDNINAKEAFTIYLSETLECVKIHDDFDVLGHLTYVCKSAFNKSGKSVKFNDFSDITDEIMKVLVSKGKGMEINTSGFDRVGEFLPGVEFVKRFKELGGEIVTVGSDSHDCTRVGQYVSEAIKILKDIFGYVCTFENRNPIFNKI